MVVVITKLSRDNAYTKHHMTLLVLQ